MKNGRQVGGYSLESYEPMDTQVEEIKSNDIFGTELHKNNFGLDIPNIYNYNKTFYGNQNLTYNNQKNVNTLNISYNAINQPNFLKLANYININPYPTITYKRNDPIAYHYSNRIKYTFPLINNNMLQSPNNFNNLKLNFLNVSQPIRSKTSNRIPPVRNQNFINNYPLKKNAFIIQNQPQISIVPKFNININQRIPIYPTITYRRTKVF